MAYTIEELFTPTPSGIGPNNVVPPNPSSSTWFGVLIGNAGTVGLNVTSWQSGSPSRSMLALQSITQAKQDALISGMNQGGFLDFAATGTVTYVDPTGVSITVPVSPDPSDPTSGNPNGLPTWLDFLSTSTFNVQRIPQAPAPGVLTIVNTSGTTPPTYPVGTYHAQNSENTSATYSNDVALTISPSTALGSGISSITAGNPIVVTMNAGHGLATGSAVYITGAPTSSNANGFWQVTVLSSVAFSLNGSSGGIAGAGGQVFSTMDVAFTADAPGPSFSAGVGDIDTVVTTNNGVFVWNFGAFTGISFESNTALAARCRLKQQALSPNGASGAYEYFALTAYTILLAETPPITLLGGPITRAKATTAPLTGAVTVTIAPQIPTTTSDGQAVVAGATDIPVTGATNPAAPAPVEITTGVAHGLSTGEQVITSGILGNSAANGTFTIAVIDGTHFTLNGSLGSGTYTGGGQVEGGDLGTVDSVIQQNCVPDGDTGYTKSAITKTVLISGTVTVPAAYRGAYLANVNAAIAAFINGLPIGGLPVSGGNGIPIDDVIGILYAAGSVAGGSSYVQNLTGVTINGAAVDLVYPLASSVGVLYPTPTITVNGA
jgi:hypothetical protein